MSTANSLIARVMSYLQIPIGAKYKKAEGKGNATAKEVKNDLLDAIVDITSDDVCVGSTPIFYKAQAAVDANLQTKLDKFVAELNKMAKWVAVDLLSEGCSTYTVKFIKSKAKLLIVPVLGDLEYFIEPDGKIICKKDDVEIKNAMIFLNYTKASLVETDKEHYYKITPVPIQLKNLEESVRNLTATEQAITRYRREISKMIRFVTVDVGSGLLDRNQDVVDAISSAINANSGTLDQVTSDMFEDEIPVFPTKGNIGKPVLDESTATSGIGEMPDLDYHLSKIFMITRFPKTYADFNTALDPTAVSLIRSDIRYSRVVRTCRSLMEMTINKSVEDINLFKQAGITFHMITLPSPEDEDAISAISGYQDFLEAFDAFIFQSETKVSAIHKLTMFENLLGEGASSLAIQAFFKTVKKAIEAFYAETKEEKEAAEAQAAEAQAAEESLKPEKPVKEEESFPLDEKDLEVEEQSEDKETPEVAETLETEDKPEE